MNIISAFSYLLKKNPKNLNQHFFQTYQQDSKKLKFAIIVRQQLQIWEEGMGKSRKKRPGFLLLLSPGPSEDCKGHPLPGGLPVAGKQVLELLWGAGSSSGCLLPPRALLQEKMYLGHGLFSPRSSWLLPQKILFLPREDPDVNVCYICCKADAEPGLLPVYAI